MTIVAAAVCAALIVLSGAKLIIDNTSADELSNMGVQRKQ